MEVIRVGHKYGLAPFEAGDAQVIQFIEKVPDEKNPGELSHKVVWALKIKSIIFDADLAKIDKRETDGSATIFPDDEGYGPVRVEAQYVRKHEPKAGGYYVVYNDGYKSWSPAEAFEAGYTKIQ